MTFDIPHMIATALIIFAVLWLVDHTAYFDGMAKGRKSLFKFAGMFIAILILNLLWPYGSSA